MFFPSGSWQRPTGGAGGSGVKVFRALVSQSGTGAPTATVLENSLGGVPEWARDAEGEYRLTLPGAWVIEKTFIAVYCSIADVAVLASRNTNNIITFVTLTSGVGTDNAILSGVNLEILVYP